MDRRSSWRGRSPLTARARRGFKTDYIPPSHPPQQNHRQLQEKRMPRFAVLVPVFLLAFAQPTYSQNSYRTILEAQLDAVQDRMSTEGYRPDTKTAYTDMIVGVL